jgi:hypothetical protein
MAKSNSLMKRSKTYKLFKKGQEQWDEFPLWLKIFVPISILYALSRRKGPIGGLTFLGIVFLFLPITFALCFIYWLIYVYYVYVPIVLLILVVGFFSWFFTVIHYRRQKEQVKEQCMDELREKYDIEDVEEEVIEVRPTRVRWKTLSYKVFGRKKTYIDIEFTCGNCGAEHFYPERRLRENKFWIQCTNCGALNLFGFNNDEQEDDGAQVISVKDRKSGINVLW